MKKAAIYRDLALEPKHSWCVHFPTRDIVGLTHSEAKDMADRWNKLVENMNSNKADQC